MDLIHKFLNLVLPPAALIAILVFLPPFLIYKLFKHFTNLFKPTENLAGKVVLITGGSSGIGEHLAYEYARRGASLALVARREERLKAVATKAVGLGSPDAIVICADVSEVEDCKRLVDETMDHFGQLDHLVNNAGVLQVSLFEDSTQLSAIRSIMDINFWGSVYCTQFAVPHLRKAKGKIVVTSSSGAWYSPPRLSVYNASKAAQISFFETLKSEYGSDVGITIVTPGLVESEMTGDQFWSKSGIKGIPVESAEGCAKAIVDSACRGDMYLTEPSWCKVGFWFKVIWPQLVQKCFHLTLVHRPWTPSSKDA
ncbi:Dehydrogenase/reductase SDR family protein 7-like protein [Morus notabilis]|uniref:Dehydrogenase/reductase SDR family protein 7-like protein n=1 Tax=Morus notabilis TaxID=981085 RepID=W9QC78_9ROSA|nr:11-beta-hydroxysteroid dehydrogenase 1B [Morus notabilis]EXB25268.1 Dehydrogenase/reductase SDR family protein 7-like protein [Morus notabilis]